MNRSGKLVCTNDYLILLLLQDPNYEVRSDGTVWTKITRTGKVSVTNTWRRAGHERKGYRIISYKAMKLQEHRIIYAKFKGTLEPDLVVGHSDDVGTNNHPDNLTLITQSANNFHRFRENGGKPPVMGHKVLTWDIVWDIRECRSRHGWPYSKISKQFGISKGHISQIVNNKIWIEGKEYA